MSRTDPLPSNRRWLVIGTVLITAFTALIIGLGLYLQRDRVHWTVTSYQVLDDQSVTVTFDVRRPADTGVVCRVRAIAFDFSTVGTVDVPIAADAEGGAEAVRREVVVRTTTRANTGTVSNCVIEGERSQ